MSSNKKYYWLKLHEKFFNQTSMKYIRKLPDGEKITIIYLKLLLESLKTDGYIYLEGLFPTIEEELALHLDEELISVQFSIAALEKINLIERGFDDWDLRMTKLPEMVGCETVAAAKMRTMREKRVLEAEKTEALPDKGNIVTPSYPVVTDCYQEKEIEKKKEKDTESEKEREQIDSGPHFYGVNKNVLLSDSEYDSLKMIYPDYLGKIDYFSAYMANTGKQYENHYLTILQWAKRDDLKRPASEVKKSGFPDYTCKEGESL